MGTPPTISIDSVLSDSVSCSGGSDGQLSVFVSAGVQPYSYSIDNGLNFQTSSIFTGLSAGNFDVLIQDANFCQGNFAANVEEPLPIQFDSFGSTDVLCFGGNDGELTVQASGGTGSIMLSIDGGNSFSSSGVFTGLSADNYSVLAQDENSCSALIQIVLDEPALLEIDSVSIQDVTCAGFADGGITIFVSGGTTPYSYSVDGLNFQSSSVYNGLGFGSLDVEILDDNGCGISTNVTIGEASPLVASLPIDTTICISGSANLCPLIAGGTPPYTYNWDGVDNGVPCLNTAVPGLHDLEVRDVNGCIAATVTQEVLYYPPLDLSAFINPTVVCAGDPVSLSAEALGGIGAPYSYVWINDLDGTVLNGFSHTIYPDQNTSYTVSVDDACETPAVSISNVINVFPVPLLNYEIEPASGCEPLTTVFKDNTDASLIADRLWDFGNGNPSNLDSLTVIYDQAGEYDVSLIITTVDGCVLDTIINDAVTVFPLPIADFEFEPNYIDLFNREVEFFDMSTNASTHYWDFGDGESSLLQNPIHLFPEIGNVTYPVELTVLSENGCTDTKTENLRVNENVIFYIPNVFTPNGDNMNEGFRPVFLPGFNPLDYEFRIFNRWGELLYVSNDLEASWSGKNQDGLIVDGTYVWQLIFRENQTDIMYQEFGHVSILR